MANIEFDRLYYYGPDRPIHVSYGPQNARKAYVMTLSRTGARLPSPLKPD